MVCHFYRLALFSVFLLVTIQPLRAASGETLARDFVQANPPQQMPSLTFSDANGRVVSLDAFRGHFLLLNFWATWCPPCVSEMPSLAALPQKIDPAQLIVLTLDEDRDGQTAAPHFFNRHGITSLPLYIDESRRALSRLDLHHIPTTFLIDPGGREIGRVSGDIDWTAAESVAFLRAAIGSGK